MIRVTENFWKIQDLLAHALVRAGRPEGSVSIVAVSKTRPVSDVLELAATGHRAFGENFVQEAMPKIDAADRADLEWHFIGHLQSNKSRDVACRFSWVHTVDRLRIAKRLSDQRPGQAGDLNVCIQVNIDNEPGKSGAELNDLPRLADSVAQLPRVRLRGLMCVPAIRSDPDEQRVPFRRLREAQEQLIRQGHSLDTLSMGMTADMEAAVLEGATIVRIGTAIFGERDTQRGSE